MANLSANKSDAERRETRAMMAAQEWRHRAEVAEAAAALMAEQRDAADARVRTLREFVASIACNCESSCAYEPADDLHCRARAAIKEAGDE